MFIRRRIRKLIIRHWGQRRDNKLFARATPMSAWSGHRHAFYSFRRCATSNAKPISALRRSRPVFLIEDADRMNESAANALLKTLEEPPTTSFLILITSQPAALLRDIRSRCQAVFFAPIPAAEIETFQLRKGVGRRATLPAGAHITREHRPSASDGRRKLIANNAMASDSG